MVAYYVLHILSLACWSQDVMVGSSVLNVSELTVSSLVLVRALDYYTFWALFWGEILALRYLGCGVLHVFGKTRSVLNSNRLLLLLLVLLSRNEVWNLIWVVLWAFFGVCLLLLLLKQLLLNDILDLILILILHGIGLLLVIVNGGIQSPAPSHIGIMPYRPLSYLLLIVLLYSLMLHCPLLSIAHWISPCWIFQLHHDLLLIRRHLKLLRIVEIVTLQSTLSPDHMHGLVLWMLSVSLLWILPYHLLLILIAF